MKLLGLFIIVCSVLSFLRKRHTRLQEEASDSFWEKEQQANIVQRKDISGLPYITIPLEKFPVGSFDEDSLRECEETLIDLADKKILNLGMQTNTDLKLAYGAANLPLLTNCEQNFHTLCQTLVSYAAGLLAYGQTEYAQEVLEYGIEIGSDISKNFLLLADIYSGQGNAGKIEELISAAEKLDSLMKPSIIEKLRERIAVPLS